jgi:SAM-dependent methyltransferase
MTAVAYHELISAGWDKRYLNGSFLRRFAFIDRQVIPVGSVSGVWLDAGCGSGTFSRMLLTNGARAVIGVDGSSGMIAQAQGLSVKEKLDDNAKFMEVGGLEALPLQDEAFDGVICFSVMEYLPDPEASLRELARILKPGGRAVISIPHRHSVLRRVQSLTYLRRNSKISAGLAYLDSSYFTINPAWAGAWFSKAGLRLIAHHSFDPFIPRFLHALLPPSLVFYELARSAE